MMQKIQEIRNYLASIYVEREDIIDGLLAAFVARQHVLLVGPPGTAKSGMVADLAKCITGTNYFQWLLTRFSTPEELFGPVSLKALEQDTYKRNTQNKLPEAHLAFVDEIFKGNSAILNALLTLANERLFYNNGGIVQSPLFSIVGASNEWPEADEGLEALFDRFILRYEVGYIQDGHSFITMLQGACPTRRPTITLEEMEQIQFQSEMMVTVPKDILEALRDIRDGLKTEGIRPSDRRFRQVLSLLKAAATIDDRDVVVRKDLSILVHSLWVTPEGSEREIVRTVVLDRSLDPVEREIAGLSDTVQDLVKQVESADLTGTQTVMELGQRIKSLKQRADKIPSGYEAVGKIQALLDETKKKLATAALGI
ncbi:ATPase RavA [Peptococcaceae bacterium CEB3]|nr:ATPase RavA [Peptococcaceae bacterium CEB3]